MARERREHRVALEILYAVVIGKSSLSEALDQARQGVGVFHRGDDAAVEDPYEPVYPAVDRRTDAPRSTDWELVERIVRGTIEHKAAIEAQIEPLLERWTLERLSGVDRVVLAMGAWELRYRPEVPATTVINHAIELARRLSTERSGECVNAILDALAKTPPAGSK